MSKILTLFVMIMLFAVPCYAGMTISGTTISGVTLGDGEVSNYDDITFFWTADSSTADYSAGDDSATLAGNAIITATDAKYGSCLSTSGTNGYSTANFDISNDDIVNGSQCSIGFWFKRLSNNASTASSGVYYNETGNNSYTWAESSVGAGYTRFVWDDGDSSSITKYRNDGDLSYDTWHFIELKVDASTSQTVAYYVDNSLVYTFDFSGDDMDVITAVSEKLYFGANGANSGCCQFDNIMISNSLDRSLYDLKDLTESPK